MIIFQPDLNQHAQIKQKKGKVLMVASAVGFREEKPFWLCKIIYVLRTEK